ncbi:uncharacterized protein M421DRAFT_102971 [Didymella exigua CBS 183.55]|uniref:Uncharacterized protein n=1 Tax=Didymella exigua CBS 183.55 TaxID=1150837 RepID=A0A6A5RBM1_9PLEO|nr:uncharacterized protein M421DRAFT_102971 [Didymella exigua CBS 183.55]KAF1925635.1 hypothetical protein M421DRAFT_102971 [Didymella exigua CBS 183.55]
MAPTTKKVPRPVFKTSSPFTETTCPSVSPEDQEIISELLCNLLAPLGEHRRAYIQPSRSKKRKRNDKAHSDDFATPSTPAVGSHILIGLNSVTRYLEALAASSAPHTVPVKDADNVDKDVSTTQADTEMLSTTMLKHFSMVVLTHPQPSLSPSHAHIPTLLHLATRQTTPTTKVSEPTRLVALSTSNDARFANALHIPRVGAIGIYEDSPGAKAVEEYVRKHVGLTECLWVDEATKPEWRGLNVQQA